MSSDWLNYNLISAAQHLMKKQFPNICGLQNTILQVTRTFEVQGSKGFCTMLESSKYPLDHYFYFGLPIKYS